MTSLSKAFVAKKKERHEAIIQKKEEEGKNE
jgi:hypothetical protein